MNLISYFKSHAIEFNSAGFLTRDNDLITRHALVSERTVWERSKILLTDFAH